MPFAPKVSITAAMRPIHVLHQIVACARVGSDIDSVSFHSLKLFPHLESFARAAKAGQEGV